MIELYRRLKCKWQTILNRRFHLSGFDAFSIHKHKRVMNENSLEMYHFEIENENNVFFVCVIDLEFRRDPLFCLRAILTNQQYVYEAWILLPLMSSFIILTRIWIEILISSLNMKHTLFSDVHVNFHSIQFKVECFFFKWLQFEQYWW